MTIVLRRNTLNPSLKFVSAALPLRRTLMHENEPPAILNSAFSILNFSVSLHLWHPSAILAALILLCRAQGFVEPSLRQRYHTRRQSIAARRRRFGLAIGGAVLL